MADLEVRSEIILTSPTGRTFSCQWAGGTRSVKKRLARYAFAGVNGEVVDDYGTDSITYPINLIFTGPIHKKTAKDFFDAFQEKGKWEVIHPTEGKMGLQGVEATENDQPVKEALVTRVDTQWVEYIDPVTLSTLRNELVDLGIQIEDLESLSVDSALSALDRAAAGVQEVNNAANSVMTNVIQAFNKAQYGIQAAVDAQEQLKDAINMGFILAVGLVSSVQNLIKAPGRALKDIKARIKTMKNIVTELFDNDSETTQKGKFDPIKPNKNDAIIKEVAATSALASVAEGVVTSIEGEENGLQSRSELLYTMQEFEALVTAIDKGVDRMATRLSDTAVTLTEPTLQDRYVPFEQTNVMVKTLKAKVRKSLMDQFFRLPTEKRIVTTRDMTLLEIAMQEWGTTGDNDEYLDKLEQMNSFTGGTVLVLPRGTQVRING